MTTKRKPYVREMKSNWWKNLGFYRFYILRESTAIPQVWFSILLLAGVFSLASGSESWESFVTFLGNPLVLVLNVFTLAATLLHTKTWFELAPKAANIVVNSKKLAESPVIKGLWGLTIVVTAVIFAIALL
jgi:fumarate reductase subunit C